MAAGDLCSLSDVRLALETPSQDISRDSLISTLISIYSSAICNEVNRQFAPVQGTVGTPVTKRFKLEMNSYRLDLDPYDLQSVSAVTISPEGPSPVSLTITDQYIPQPVTQPDGVYTSIEFSHILASLYSSQTFVRYGFTQVDVSGVWGFPAIPPSVQQACILAVTSAMRRDVSAFAMNTEDALMLATERAATYGLPPSSRRLLNAYRRHLVF